MIVRDTPSRMDLLFALRGSIVPAVAPSIVVLVAISAAMVAGHQHWGLFPEVDATGFTVFGIALSLFLGFRNNAAYDRWWEARKLWGGLLADLRSFARELDMFVADEALRHSLLRLSLAFVHTHRAHLRQIPNDPQAKALAGDLASTPHPPDAVLDRMASTIGEAYRSGRIDGFGAKALQERLAGVTLAQTGSQRIATTPLPYVYSLLIYRTTYLYCLLLPLALVGPAGWMTPLFVGIVAYALLGLAEVSEELSHPFGTTQNALPLDAICRAVEVSLAPHLGEPAPEQLQAKNFYLS